MVNPHHLAHWYPTAAYLYVLWLDALALAWEYLRRHPDYRLDWLRRHRRPEAAHRWGLRLLEDPALDARDAHPRWLPGHAAVVQLYPDADPPPDATAFAFWRIPGHKHLLHDGKGSVADRTQPQAVVCASRSRPAWKTAWLSPMPTAAALSRLRATSRPAWALLSPNHGHTCRAAGTAHLAGARRDSGGRVLARCKRRAVRCRRRG